MLRSSLLLIAAFLSGCGMFTKKDLYSGYSNKEITSETLKPYSDIKKALINENIITAACMKNPVATGSEATCTAERNNAISSLALASENLCTEHRRSIYGNDASFNVTTGTFTNIFAGAATVATAQTGKSILSALALFSNAERSLGNETIYKQALVSSIDKKIVELRETKAEEINTKLDSQNVKQYPTSRALNDFYKFHYSCSFMDGLRLALDEGSQESDSRKLSRLKSNLTSLSAEIEVQCDEDRNALACTEAEERFKSLSGTVKALESQ
ncbi:hypothetical protein [Pseudomonas leptonychotis]|uniref:hypothetical protein n=1 Tax=Pseudomonas leptonychotis TaxID=2448482 RepID=UPI0010AA099E|nr:hypothetical protein [Pseudomonas leptonychotis]